MSKHTAIPYVRTYEVKDDGSRGNQTNKITKNDPYLHIEDALSRSERRGHVKKDVLNGEIVYYRKLRNGNFMSNSGHQVNRNYFFSKAYLNKFVPEDQPAEEVVAEEVPVEEAA